MLVCSVGILTAVHFGGFWEKEVLEWDEEEYVERNGIFFSLYSEYVNSRIEVPEGYSNGLAEQILNQYPVSENEDADKMPDSVYVIMNEAFADYSYIGELSVNADPLEGIHALNDNCIKGKCAVNVFGGHTCNTEFEFLTGCSLMFMPNDTIPYVQFSLEERESFTSDMNALSYDSKALHPYFAEEWKRTQVYSGLGFSKFISGELFSEQYVKNPTMKLFDDINEGRILSFGDDLEYVRGFISDAECYRKMMKEDTGEKLFLFAVTIQNHGGYEIEDFYDPDMTEYADAESAQANAEQYLNLLRISDHAFCDLLDELRKSDRKTVVLMFGDHEPGIEFRYFTQRYSKGGNQYQKKADEYIVPYILWANYEIDWEVPEFLSINYLSAVLKQNCGFPLTQFDQLRLSVMNEFPVITSQFAVNQEGEYISPEQAKTAESVQNYEIVQYQRLFE